MTYLDGFLDGGSPLGGLTRAEAINEAGLIVGEAWAAAFAAIPRP